MSVQINQRINLIVGDGYYKDTSVTATPGTEQTVLISDAVPLAKKRSIHRVVLDAAHSGTVKVFHNLTEIGGGRTSPARLTFEFDFIPARPSVTGDTFTVKFEQRASSPVALVKCYLMAEDLGV